ncbi:MarR family transcriptional regulator [Rhodosalinus halophilus]|uniref:MarR family transcriptional regulator n=1 Tax=Rhodosalinus halophilus TaxID=2259333 RepID=A0A365U621_9RHOB|nr:MarR family winged helix-turn-helix transcriptional regulator [Rhodosalinus halophilus]RBI83675.1 MarR family transcriptional regulator [Rhodosalinus halophilus]
MDGQPGGSTNEDRQGESFVPNYLLYLLAAASEAASAQFHAHVRAQGVRVPEWRVLACLADRDGEMVTRLAGYALIEQSRLTKIIAQMDAKGWVTRRGDSQDRRRVRVFLTEAGRALAERLVQDARAHEAQLLAKLEGGDAARIKQALATLIDELGAAQHRTPGAEDFSNE